MILTSAIIIIVAMILTTSSLYNRSSSCLELILVHARITSARIPSAVRLR